MTTVSIDLAYGDYADMGVAVINAAQSDLAVEFVGVALSGPPHPEHLARWLVGVCQHYGATVLLLDGPQGWKDAANGLEHSRQCERALNTPAKTGLPGEVKPKSYGRFVAFSITVFDALAAHGWARYTGAEQRRPGIACESFPLGAWRSLQLPPVPAKRGCTVSVVAERARDLSEAHNLRLQGCRTTTSYRRSLPVWLDSRLNKATSLG